MLFANFTGYLLPWDQISYWAIKVGANIAGYMPLAGDGLRRFMLGGSDLGPETLLRSFAFHVGMVPALLLLFVPLLDRSPGPGGIWLARDRWWHNLVFLAILASQIAFIVVGGWLRGANWQLILPF